MDRKNWTLPISTRLPIDIVEQITTESADKGISRSQYMALLMVKGLKADEDAQSLKNRFIEEKNANKILVGTFIKSISKSDSELRNYVNIYNKLKEEL